MKEFSFQITHLKNANFLKADQLPVLFYSSNALDSFYTSKKEFKKLLDNINNSITENQVFIIIHHAGGRPEFGIYQIRKTGDKSTLTTLCKDTYKTASNPPFSYKTHFE